MRHRKVRSWLILDFSSFWRDFYFCQDFRHWWRTNMRTHILYVPLICITFTNWSEALNFYTGTVTTNTSNVIFDTLLSGNDLFENLYGTFNNTGLLLFGGALLLGSGKLETEWEWFHFLGNIDDIIWSIVQLNSNVSLQGQVENEVHVTEGLNKITQWLIH